MERFKAWWFLWKEETFVIIGASTALVLFIWGAWYLFQTMPLPLEEGVISGHNYTAQYEEDHDGGTTCWSRDKSGVCTFSTQNADIHHVHCRGGCYEIQVEGCSNDRRGDKHCRKEWRDVGKAQYEDCVKGRLWKRGESVCFSR